MSSIPFFLITGFLGSGKTTLLKRILDSHADGHKLAIIQNEFAPGNVDGTELKQTGKSFEMLEINKGSVFCVCLMSDFVKSLSGLIETVKPDAIVLEATGLADPIAVAQLLQTPGLAGRVYLSHVWSIVDATTFLDMQSKLVRVKHQVRVADTIVINKTDKAPESTSEITKAVRELNPFAEVVHTSYCAFPLDRLFGSDIPKPVAVQRRGENAKFESCGRPPVGSCAIRTTSRPAREALEGFLKTHSAETYRLKGFVTLAEGPVVAIQSCFGETTVETIEGYSGPNEIVVMGPEIDPAALTREFEQLSHK